MFGPPPACVRALAAALAIAAVVPGAARGDAPPSPVTPDLFAFPSTATVPGSARSAALARADRWLGDEPFDNPAAAPPRGVVLSPVLQRVSRQDLRAGNRNYDETSFFLDLVGGSITLPVGRMSMTAYLHQPVLRLEGFAFTRGPEAIIPGAVNAEVSQRELRGGLAASIPAGPVRVGLAGEWTQRSDTYDFREQSGSPDAGTRRADFSGGVFGGQAGVRFTSDAPWGGTLVVAAGGRYLPPLSVDGGQELLLLGGDSTATISAERESGWEGGAAASLPVGSTFRVLLSAGGRSAMAWRGFGVEEGRSAEWKVAGEFHDPRDAWTFRVGLGEEQQTHVPESRAGVIGLGLGWRFEGTVVDFSLMRRTIERESAPTSYDDRVVGSVIVPF